MLTVLCVRLGISDIYLGNASSLSLRNLAVTISITRLKHKRLENRTLKLSVATACATLCQLLYRDCLLDTLRARGCHNENTTFAHLTTNIGVGIYNNCRATALCACPRKSIHNLPILGIGCNLNLHNSTFGRNCNSITTQLQSDSYISPIDALVRVTRRCKQQSNCCQCTKYFLQTLHFF